ncbi:hypothetical protein A3I27_04550 [Candidatus Giovannonibacteria bacterium RIFCSPLOWO2_02_FULL_43_11b]|uniref:LamG-like jellyroll fold domain-containing protein n=1 Tax=Candidatus Giovannonibacteria bacterium RIFCSPHIGHO2_12_FULL_43_15 TaxID=1798341 RepID=A0A1F5WRE2_9BACT|nr:MAG: hypothetical protein A3B97_00285 [Candidatus Giovannonibacteria bacterium RIFCSPHIGHO2_02_FULL_43_32]OGF78228.1 MAG: hypothetical protein A3F23_02245 [Candidatus Giovannonibacteria bacterium RIFCSPHIGHO2_12_FULL_43_15]OGF78376.1 MAG: hypothetical protein A3A15_03310 [Candidatus Giovannonibacteria bacterium RIFCSPLOWO2_01_FULL_43_60]OGF90298.1 MAG: hypothetical protein A3I27_04550 [Candidatus Giovannonibacteria bacterium RIFCSPLOWO2_02_FULL_43_11b]OGF92156.1 MAG: hypothetical protein A3H
MKNSNGKLVQNTLKSLEREFVVVGKTRVRSWHAWLAIGIAVGISAGILFVANRSGEFGAGMAASLAPIGAFENITATGLAYGWTLDQDVVNQSIDVHFYIDAPVGQGGEFAGSVSANMPSSDVNSIGYSGNHRFSFTIPNVYRDAKTHQLYVYAIDPVGGSNPLLGGSPKTFSINNRIPVGNFEGISSGGVASGWALDIDSQPLSVSVHFYLDKPVDQGGAFIGSAVADKPRLDVNSATGYSGNHGFNFTIPNVYRDAKTHQLYVYAIDLNGGYNPLVAGSPLSFKIDASLVSEWKFESNLNKKLSDSLQENIGTIVGNSAIVSGKIGNAFQFNGTSDRIDINNSNNSGSKLRYILRGGGQAKSFTITAWFNQQGCGKNGYIIGRLGWINGLTVDCGAVAFSLYKPDGSLKLVSHAIDQNNWYFVTVAYDKTLGRMWMFLNGVLVNEVEVGSSLRDNDFPVQIGGQAESDRFFKGLIDDIRIYDRALSEKEIIFIFNEAQASSAMSPKTAVMPLSSKKKVFTWDPLVKKECYSTYITPQAGQDCSGTQPINRWVFGTTNEDVNFEGGALNSFLPDGKVAKFAFNDKGDGTYQIGWVVDKVSFDLYRDKYTFFGFTDSWDVNKIAFPTLDQDVHSSFRLKLMAQDQLSDPSNGLAKNRVMIGAVATWNGRTHFVEVNLWNTDNFDLCKGICDPDNIFDRRTSYKNVDSIYFNGPKLSSAIDYNSPSLSPGGAFQDFDIPWTRLYQNYVWSDPPASWKDIKLQGVYIGTEVWGKGRVWTEFDNYQTYSLVP